MRGDTVDTIPFTGTPRLPNFDYAASVQTPSFQTFSLSASLLVGQDENFFLYMAQPPQRTSDDEIPPREYIFVVDVSGSMNGFPLDTSKQLLRDLIGRLRPTDLFNVVLFAGDSAVLSPESLEKLRKINAKDLPLVTGSPRIGACVAGVGKFICIGLNYSDHAAEANLQVPAEPVLFTKAVSCIQGPNDDVRKPRDSFKMDCKCASCSRRCRRR